MISSLNRRNAPAYSRVVRQTRRLGRYHLTYRIAFGGMAELYRAFTFDEDGHKRDVAIKRLLPHFREDR
jgi:serine/threonine-protein kinase